MRYCEFVKELAKGTQQPHARTAVNTIGNGLADLYRLKGTQARLPATLSVPL